MSNLILFTDLEPGTLVDKLAEYIQRVVPTHDVCNVWMDPRREPRAVAYFGKEIDLTEIQDLCRMEKFSAQKLWIDLAEPASSICVRTYQANMFGVVDKLKYLFSSKKYGGAPVVKVERATREIEGDIFEVFFQDGWDCVREVSDREWHYDKQKLSVTPYFDCFKEDPDDQLKRLKAEYKRNRSHLSTDDPVRVNSNSKKSSSAAVHKLSQLPLQQLAETTKSSAKPGSEELELGQDSNEDNVKYISAESHPRSSVTTDNTESEVEQRTNKSSISLLFDHHITLILLKYLKFDEAAKDFGVTVVFKYHENGIEILGSREMRKDFQKMLTGMENQIKFSKCVEEFFADELVQQDLKTFLELSHCTVDIVTNQGKPHLEVNTGEKKETFQNFVTSLVIVETVWSGPLKHSTQLQDFIKSFKSEKPVYHISLDDESVQLVYLTSQPDKQEIVALVKRKLIDLMPNSQQSVRASERTPRSKGNKYLTLDCHNKVMPWMLNAWKFSETVKQEYGVDIKMDEEEDKISISGQNEAVQIVKKLILEEDEKMAFPKCVQDFLADEFVQQDLGRFFELSGCSANVVTTQDRAHIEVSTGKKKETFQDFVTSLVIVETVWSGPLKHSAQLEDFIKSFENEKPRYHIRVDDKSIQLVYLASQPDKNDVVANVQNELKKLMSQQFGHASERTPRSKSMKKMTLDCQNTILLWMLKALKFKETVKQEYGVDIEVDEEEDKIIISGQDEGVQSVKKIIQDEDNKLHLTEDEKELFNLDEIRRRIHYSVEERGLKCCLSCSSLKIVDKSLKEITIKEFLSKLVDVRSIPVPKEYINSTQWKGMADILPKYKSCCLIGYKDSGINLMTVNSQYHDDIDRLMGLIIQSGAEWKNSASSRAGTDDSHDVGQDEGTFFMVDFCKFLPCKGQKQHYCEFFLKSEIAKWGKESALTIVKTREGFEVKSKELNQSAYDHLQSLLHKIVSREHEFQFPGLVPFLNSEGKEFLSNFQEAYRCFIEVPGPASVGPVQLKKSAETLSVQKYDFVHLGTARTEDHRFHLIQGDLENLNLSKIELTLKFIPKAEPGEECGISIDNLISCISLPPWQHPDVVNYHVHFQKLRESFAEQVSHFITYAWHNNCSVVAISTELIQKSHESYPFPVEVIAETLVTQLYQKWQELCIKSSEARQVRRSLDVFVCEPNNENIFKSFKFFLKKKNAYLGIPDKSCWDQVCHYGPEDIPKYSRLKKSSRKVIIEVKQSNNYHNSSQGTLFCYPIAPSLEAATCPATREGISDKQVESCVRSLLRGKPDGLMPGETFQLRGFRDNRDAIAYCCPDWGWDCAKAIQSIVEECLQSLDPGAAAHYEAVHFIPPGLYCSPKYPLGYLTQTFFKALDKFLDKNTNFRNKSIILVVPDISYAQAFDKELQKRYAVKDAKAPEGWLNKISSWFSFSNSSNTGKSRTTGSPDEPATLQNDVPSTTLTFWSLYKTSADEAADELRNELQKLVKRERLTLSKRETFSFLDMLKKQKDFFVQISFEKNYYKENPKAHHPQSHSKQKPKANVKKGNRNKGDAWQQSNNQSKTKQEGQYVLKGSTLIIEGLSETYISEFRNMVKGLTRHEPDSQLPAINSSTASTHENYTASAGDAETQSSFHRGMEVSSAWETGGQEKDTQDEHTSITSRIKDPTSETSETTITGTQFHNASESVPLQTSSETSTEKSHAKRLPGQENQPQASGGQVVNESENSLDRDVNDPPSQFRWLYETKPRGGAIVYQYFEEAVGRQIEDAYTKQKSGKVKLEDAGPFANVKFTPLAVTTRDKKFGIIRREKIQIGEQDDNAGNADFRLLELDTQSSEYNDVSGKLRDCLKSKKLKLQQIERVENTTLFRRFTAKSSQMKIDMPQRMWCRVTKDVVQLISEYGFHPKFDSMHCDIAMRLGEGVIFFEKPEQCLQTLASKEEIILVNALVLVGRTRKGKNGLRNPSADTKAPFDSVADKKSGAFMIFTDTQACPQFVVTLERK